MPRPGATKSPLVRLYRWRTNLRTDAVQRLFADEYENLVSRITFQTGQEADAEDLAMRAFERLHVSVQRGDDVGDLLARLNLIAQGVVIDYWRAADARPETPGGLGPDLDQLAQHRPLTVERHEFASSFDRAVRLLPAEERDAFILTDLRGLTVREAAPTLGVGYTTVARRRQAAHTFVRKELS